MSINLLQHHAEAIRQIVHKDELDSIDLEVLSEHVEALSAILWNERSCRFREDTEAVEREKERGTR